MMKASTHGRRRFVASAASVSFAFLLPSAKGQQETASGPFPNRPIRIIVAFAAGGAADVVIRRISTRLGALLGTQVIVENRPGANGNIAAEFVAKSKPDGYTLLSGFPGLTSNPSLYKSMSYQPLKDLVPIKMLAVAPVLLVAYPGLKAQTVADLIALAKADPNGLRFGSAGQGSSGHLAGELFKMVAGVQMQHVPYRGGALALNDAMGGQIDIVFDSIPGSRAMVDGKKLKALALAGERRSDALPSVPTFKEAGLSEYYANTWFGLLMPQGTPADVSSRLAAAITQMLNEPDIQANLDQIGLVADNRSSEQFAQFMQSETAKWARVVKTANIHIE
jgi:tripartite-type tricarboxylate transporter receptor subunit TctC